MKAAVAARRSPRCAPARGGGAGCLRAGCPGVGWRGAGHALDAHALNAVCEQVEAYYSAKLARHGANPHGVDWSCAATQWLRFVQLLKICSFDTPFSLIDLGCGYGALAAFLADRYPHASVEYLGIDLSPAMVRRARRRYRGFRRSASGSDATVHSKPTTPSPAASSMSGLAIRSRFGKIWSARSCSICDA